MDNIVVFDDDEELLKDLVVANFAITAKDGKTYNVEHCNMDSESFEMMGRLK